jgi:hypothetical protein
MKPLQIALAPELGIRPEDFVAAWNETPACREAAEAQFIPAPQTQFDPLLAAGVAALVSIGTGLITNVLSELIKQALARRQVNQAIDVIEVQQADGSRLLVVKVVKNDT